MRGHELSMAAEERPVPIDEEHRVVERRRALAIVLLVQPDDGDDAGARARFRENFRFTARDPHRLVVKRDDRFLPKRRALGAGIPEIVAPVRIRRDARLRGDDEVDASLPGIENGFGILLDALFLLHEDGTDLRGGGNERLVQVHNSPLRVHLYHRSRGEPNLHRANLDIANETLTLIKNVV